MAYDRNLLKQKQIEGFKAWLDENQLAWRPGKGQYQIIQLRMENGNGWSAICIDEKSVISTEPSLRNMINLFKQGKPWTGGAPAKCFADAAKDSKSIKEAAFLEDLRDDFAVSALSVLAHQAVGDNWSAAEIALRSYELADAMMEARKVKL